VRALLGENGAGKSTLLGVLFGSVRPDAGCVLVRGVPVSVRSSADAGSLGIGLVHQHVALAPSLTVAENVELGLARGEGVSRFFPRRFDQRAAEKRTADLAERTGLDVDPRARTGDLPLGVRQRVEILKALRRDARVLLLDEPTAVLAPPEVDQLFSVLARLRAEGRSILIITHKLREVARLADRVTVLRRGKIVAADSDARTATLEELAALMVGTDAAATARAQEEAAAAGVGTAEVREAVAPALALREVSVAAALGREALHGVTLEVRPGEIVGIVGVAGNGQETLFELATGLRAPEAGRVELAGRAAVADPRAFIEARVAAIPADRAALALAQNLTATENLALKELAVGRTGWISWNALRTEARERLERFEVRPPDPDRRAGDLSGGNQQKLVLARELAGTPPVVVALDPARGLDVRAAAFVARELEAARARGAAILLVSTDLDEVVSLATRAFALHAGRLVTGSAAKPSRDELGRLMLGGEAAL
jgi:simple sugar transport system ATP-binding protein